MKRRCEIGDNVGNSEYEKYRRSHIEEFEQLKVLGRTWRLDMNSEYYKNLFRANGIMPRRTYAPHLCVFCKEPARYLSPTSQQVCFKHRASIGASEH